MDTPQYTSKQVARFWSRVDCKTENECWNWQALKDKDGYGRFFVCNTGVRSHRFAYELATGVNPGILDVLHSCDNPACCNPRHLSLGTNTVNVDDRQAKHREAKGELIAQHKLTSSQVSYIRVRYAQGGITQKELGAEMGIHKSVVGRIIKREIWKHID